MPSGLDASSVGSSEVVVSSVLRSGGCSSASLCRLNVFQDVSGKLSR